MALYLDLKENLHHNLYFHSLPFLIKTFLTLLWQNSLTIVSMFQVFVIIAYILFKNRIKGQVNATPTTPKLVSPLDAIFTPSLLNQHNPRQI